MPGLYTTQDIYMTDSGDFAVTENGDLRSSDMDETVRQEAILTLYTPVGEFDSFPIYGSKLMDFIGEPNSRDNAALMRKEVVRALTQLGSFSADDIEVTITPIGIDDVLINLDIQNVLGIGEQSLTIDFNYIKGIQITN
ncbi:MAG: hypothetical protein WC932_04970 [archaeon]|jgi:hypothetical protein